jgi:TUP1-like enhancer of split
VRHNARQVLSELRTQTPRQRQLDSVAHLEAALAAAEATGCGHDWANYLVQYVKLLCSVGDAGRLTELCSSLLGPLSWRPPAESDMQVDEPGAPWIGLSDVCARLNGLSLVTTLCLVVWMPCCGVHRHNVMHCDCSGARLQHMVSLCVIAPDCRRVPMQAGSSAAGSHRGKTWC